MSYSKSPTKPNSRILLRTLLLLSCITILIPVTYSCAWTQGVGYGLGGLSSFSIPDLSPSRPLSFPLGFSESGVGDIQTVPLSYDLFQDVLPQIPKLRLGYLYTFGKDLSWGRMTGDFFVPMGLSSSSTVFGQFHVEFQDYWRLPFAGAHHRVDLSAGAGYRKLINRNLMLGANAFYDSTRILSDWYSSAGAGAEAAIMLPNFDVLDFTYNYYGNLSRGNHGSDGEIINGPPNMDFELGYSHALFGRSPDLRARINAYNYDIRQAIWGFKGGVDLTLLNGALTFRGEVGRDQLYGSYQTVGAFVNIPIRLDNIFTWKSPFVLAGGSTGAGPQGVGNPGWGRERTTSGNISNNGSSLSGQGAPGAGYMYPYSPYPNLGNQDVIPTPLYLEPQSLLSFMTEPVRRQFASHAVSVTAVENDEVPALPNMFAAIGDAYVVFTLNPKYTAPALNNIKPTSVSIAANVTSRGPVNITGMQLNVKDTNIVWVLDMPDWTTGMGLYYSYNLTASQIDELWRVLTVSPDRSIAEIRFNQLTGMNLKDLAIFVTIKQEIPKPSRTTTP